MNFVNLSTVGYYFWWFTYWTTASAQPTTPEAFLGNKSPSESVILGPKQIPTETNSRGTWTLTAGQLFLKGAAEKENSFWVVPAPAANGTIRARLVSHRPIRASLLLKAQLDKRQHRLVQAYLLEIDQSFAWLSEINNERVSSLGQKIWLPGMRSRKRIEIELAMFGSHLVANIYDANSNQTLGILSASGVSPKVGSLGMFLPHDQTTSTRLDFLSWRAACSEIPSQSRGDPIVFFSPISQVKKLNRLATPLEVGGREENRAVYKTDLFGLERIFCQGIPFGGVTTDLPWKYLDLEYLESKKTDDQRSPSEISMGRSYKDPKMVNRILGQFHKRHPRDSLLKTIGTSVQGRPIHLLAIGRDIRKNRNRPSVLLNAAIHGDEILSIEFVLDAIQSLLEPPPGNPEWKHWLDEFNVFCVPLVNPDGLYAFIHNSVRAGRKNGHDFDNNQHRDLLEGVDLNRNFPFQWGKLKSSLSPDSRFYRGKKPGSEPETQALMRLANQERFVFSISYHLGNVVILAPYTTGGVANPAPNEAWLVAEELSRQLQRHPEGPAFRVQQRIYPVDGVEQDFYRHAYGTVALLLEGGRWPPPIDPILRQRIIDALRPSVFFLMNRFSQGPSLSLAVHRKNSRPVVAEIRIEELINSAQEVWTTRRRDGSFHRFLPSPGTYHLSVHVPGFAPIERTIQVSDEHAQIIITLPR